MAANNIEALLSNPDITRQIEELQKIAEVRTEVLSEPYEDTSEDFNYASLLGTIFTAINGQDDVKDQSVRVEYLTTDQVLVIPAGLAMDPLDERRSIIPNTRVLIDRFKRASQMTYLEMKNLVDADQTVAQKKAAFDQRPIPTGTWQTPDWSSDEWYALGTGRHDPPYRAHYTIGCFSRIIGFNCDVRDMGYLTMDDNRVRVKDDQWAHAIEDLTTRFYTAVQPYTLQCIAALNYEACGRWDIGAWVRAFGVGCGLLPSEDTRLNKEWKYVRRHATEDVFNAIKDTHKRVGVMFKTMCINVIAMFGLFHLAKNHTYRTNDQNMERIGISYIQTLRTMVPNQIIEEMKSHQEVIVRTAPHPFGLGQSYWLAKALAIKESIAIPLGLRVSVTPPPVQRLMIVEAASKEWQSLPIAEVINAVFGYSLDIIKQEIALIKVNAARYSELHLLYGVQARMKVSEPAMTAANAMMPLVDGFAQALHAAEGEKKDGLALAQSFANVERDNKALTATFASLWKNYVGGMDTAGLDKFLRQTYADQMAAPAAGAGTV